MRPLVSIIIPVFNVEKYIHQCLDSVLTQTYKNLEIILVDDGSPDNCPEICDKYSLEDKRIKVIHKKNGGQSSARNAGMDIMSGKYFLFLDSDDCIHSKCVEYCVNAAETYNADLVQFDFTRGTTCRFEEELIENKKVSIFDNRTIFESSMSNVILCGKMYTSSVHKDIRMPIGRLNEDDATTWKFYYRSNNIVILNYKFYFYRVNPDSTMANLQKKPNITYPMLAYHERIKFFDDIKDKHLSDLSKWRYCKYLMLAIGNPLHSMQDRKLLYNELKGIWKNVFFCKPVPLSNKILLLITLFSPTVTYKVLSKIR